MPYLLKANPPGSPPQSWVKMETESVRSANSDFGVNPRGAATPSSVRAAGRQFNQFSHLSGAATLGHASGGKFANYANANVASAHLGVPTTGGQIMNHHPTVANFSSLINGSQQLNNSSSTNNSSGQHNTGSSSPPLLSPTSVLSNYSLVNSGSAALSNPSAVNGGRRHHFNGSPLNMNSNR